MGYWRLTSILPYCCQDTNGKIYASGKVISTEKLNDTCSTEITTICKYNGDWNNVTGVITTTHIAPDCCLDNNGKQHPVNKEIPDSTTCSKRICRSGKPTGHWSRCQVEYGINCCLYNGTMIPDGKPLEPQPSPESMCPVVREDWLWSTLLKVPEQISDKLAQNLPKRGLVNNEVYTGKVVFRIKSMSVLMYAIHLCEIYL